MPSTGLIGTVCYETLACEEPTGSIQAENPAERNNYTIHIMAALKKCKYMGKLQQSVFPIMTKTISHMTTCYPMNIEIRFQIS